MTVSITWHARGISKYFSFKPSLAVCTDIDFWCEPSNPLEIYEHHKEAMTEDFLHRHCTRLSNVELDFNDDIFNLAINDLQDKVFSMGGRELSEYGLPQPQTVDNDRFARAYHREIDYNQGEQEAFVKCNLPLLTTDQREVYDCFCSMIGGNEGGMLILDAPGGTGRMFFINLIPAKLRSEGKIRSIGYCIKWDCYNFVNWRPHITQHL